MKKILEYNKRLEGAVLRISNPPLCNSILVTGLTKNTTKQAIEMYFENEKNGGGKIYGGIIYQKEKGKAVVSFCDPHGKANHSVYSILLCFHITNHP
jgi:predicted RNase H-like HicB family nuclease